MGQEIRPILFQSRTATGPSITSEPPEKYFYVKKTLCMINILSQFFFRRVKDGEKKTNIVWAKYARTCFGLWKTHLSLTSFPATTHHKVDSVGGAGVTVPMSSWHWRAPCVVWLPLCWHFSQWGPLQFCAECSPSVCELKQVFRVGLVCAIVIVKLSASVGRRDGGTP